MSFHHVLQDVPYHGFLAVNNLFGRFHGLDDAALQELADYERLIKFGRHVFGEAAFMHFQFGTYNDYRTCGVVHTLTEKVLAETALLALERVGERFERTVGV